MEVTLELEEILRKDRAFYQKSGFRMLGIRRDYFADYPEPIIENGIRGLDMVLFERQLLDSMDEPSPIGQHYR